MMLSSSQYGDGIPGTDGSLFQHDGENSLPGHDAVAHLLADGAVGMAFLSDPGHLRQDFSNPEPGAHREGVKDQPSVKIFSAKAPTGISGKTAFIFSTLSCASRLT